MRQFPNYLKSRRRELFLFFLFFAIFMVSFLLFRLPLSALLYPGALCALAGTGYLLWDYFRTRRVCDLLSRLSDLADCAADSFPPAESLPEAEYQKVLSLLSARERAKAAAEARRYEDMVEYYTVWAHQIKTPIAAIRLHLQNEDTPLSRRVGSELLRIEQYVEMVLTFLRLDSGTQDYVFRQCELDNILRRAVKKYAGEFISRHISLEYAPLGVSVLTDEKWLTFVVEQLLSNALKYTPAGSISITLEAPMTLCIRDTGIGIAPEDLPRVFEQGYTGCNGRIDQKATGIGLCLCRRICRRLGHTITISSQVDKGTAVRIDLRRESRLFD